MKAEKAADTPSAEPTGLTRPAPGGRPTVVAVDATAGEPRNTNAGAADNNAVRIWVVSDPTKLMAGGRLRFHDDVVEALTDLVLDLVDKDEDDAANPGGR